MTITDPVRSAKSIRSDTTLEEIDVLCSVLEGAERDQPRARAVKRSITMKREIYPNFGLLRLLLAAEVMLFHLHVVPARAGSGWYINPVPSFIAISGFLILQSFEQSPSWPRFAWKRLCRVGPGFITALVLVAFASGFSAIPPTLADYVMAGLSGRTSADGPLWSLMVEEILYAALALGVVIGIYRAKWPVWLWVVLGATVIPLLLLGYPRRVERIGWVLATFPIGSLMYIYRHRLARVHSITWITLLVLCLAFPPYFADRVMMQLWTMAEAVAVVGIGAWGPKLVDPKWDVSYGLYLYHIPIYNLLQRHGWPISATVSIAVLIAAISWRFIERPALRLKNLSWQVHQIQAGS